MTASQTTYFILGAIVSLGLASEPTLNCPVPVSPPNGQVSLLSEGSVVRYACDPGYQLVGPVYSSCIDDRWFPEAPQCITQDGDPIEPTKVEWMNNFRPLFKWDKDENDTSTPDGNDDMLSDEARLRLFLYPESRYVATRLEQIRSGSELEDEEQKRSKSKISPPILFARRPSGPFKTSDAALLRREALHTVVDENGIVRVVPAAEKGVQSDEALRYMYYYSHYVDPRYASWHYSGYPYSMALSESQVNWINSLQPEVRDKYLRDLYNMRVGVVDDASRAQAYYQYYGDDVSRAQAYYQYYGDNYHWMYNYPYYYSRQRMSALVEENIANYDYSCYQTEDDGRVTKVRAPQLHHAYVHRYDRRQNPNQPHNNYLAAQYRCKAGYTLLDKRINELYCRQKSWVGVKPVCVPH